MWQQVTPSTDVGQAEVTRSIGVVQTFHNYLLCLSQRKRVCFSSIWGIATLGLPQQMHCPMAVCHKPLSLTWPIYLCNYAHLDYMPEETNLVISFSAASSCSKSALKLPVSPTVTIIITIYLWKKNRSLAWLSTIWRQTGKHPPYDVLM